MLNLNPGIHLHEIEVLILIQKEFNGSRVLISHCLGCLYSGVAHGFSQAGGNHITGGFLQHLLVASLDGAVTLSQMYHIAVLVGHDLEFHMPWLFNVFLNIHGVVGKSLNRFHLSRVEQLRKVLLAPGNPHALTAAAG